MIGERRMLFEKRFPVYAEFTRLGELEVGAPVQRGRRESRRGGRHRAADVAVGKVQGQDGASAKPCTRSFATDSIAVHADRGSCRRRLRQHRPRAPTRPPLSADGGTISEPRAVRDQRTCFSRRATRMTIDQRYRHGGRGDVETAVKRSRADRRGCARAARRSPARPRSDCEERQA